MHKIKITRKLITVVILILLVIPTLIIGELVINVSRHREYEDPSDFQSLVLDVDGISIQTWYTNTSSKLAIIVHGHFDNAGIILERYGSIYQDLGYDLLLIDLRNHGRSDDDKPVMGGVKAAKDIVAVLEWTSNQSWEENIIVATSMGAVASIVALSEIDPKFFPDTMILDSIYLDIDLTLDLNLKKHKIPQPWRFLILNYILKLRFNQLEFPDILLLLHQIDTFPILILHGSKDVESPIAVIDLVETEAYSQIQTARIEGGMHSRLFKYPEYADMVELFIS